MSRRKLVKRTAELWFWHWGTHFGDYIKVSSDKPEDESDHAFMHDYSFCTADFKKVFGLLGLRRDGAVRQFRVTIEEIPE